MASNFTIVCWWKQKWPFLVVLVFTWGEEKSMRGASVTVGRAAGDWEMHASQLCKGERFHTLLIHLRRSWGLLDCPLFCLALTFVLLIPIISGWVMRWSLQNRLKNRLFVGKWKRQLTSTLSGKEISPQEEIVHVIVHLQQVSCQLVILHLVSGAIENQRENAKRISFNKTYLVYQLHQATLHSSTGSMESLKHGPVLQTRIKLSSMKIWEDIINLGMFKARFELWEHLGEDGHVLLCYPQVPPHLRNLLWLHVCKRRHLSSLLTVLWQNMF